MNQNLVPLTSATLYFGKKEVPVFQTSASPIPDMDITNPMDAVFKTMAVMSMVAGGLWFQKAKLFINEVDGSVHLLATGFSIIWGTGISEGLDPAHHMTEAIIRERAANTRMVKVPFDVISPQHDNGWELAIKVPQ